MPRTFLATFMAAALFATAPVLAQGGDATPSLTVDGDVLKAGTSVQVSYSNPGMAGQTVVIDVDNGMRRNTQVSTIEVTLDANGHGSAMWNVPAWMVANFNAPGVPEVTCAVH